MTHSSRRSIPGSNTNIEQHTKQSSNQVSPEPAKKEWKATRPPTKAFDDSTLDLTDKEKRFTRSPDLPAELRIKIWWYALPGPRTIIKELQLKRRVEDQRWYGRTSIEGSLIDNMRPPVLLGVCVESRELASRYAINLRNRRNIRERHTDSHTCSFIIREYTFCFVRKPSPWWVPKGKRDLHKCRTRYCADATKLAT